MNIISDTVNLVVLNNLAAYSSLIPRTNSLGVLSIISLNFRYKVALLTPTNSAIEEGLIDSSSILFLMKSTTIIKILKLEIKAISLLIFTKYLLCIKNILYIHILLTKKLCEMNKLLLLVLIFICISCNDMDENINLEQSAITEINNILRSLQPNNFENNWENQTDIILTRGDSVKLPWARSSTSDTYPEVNEDIKKENGWTFMSTDNTDLGSDYLIFYNKYTGILKLFYYNTNNQPTNCAMWFFRDLEDIGWLKQGTYFTTPISEKIYSSEIGVAPLSLSRTKGISQGWNAVQVPLTYVGLGTKGYIDVSPEVSNISEIMLEGNYNEVTEGTIIEKHSSNKASELVNSVAKAGGKAADKWINEKISGSTSILKNIPGVAGGKAANKWMSEEMFDSTSILKSTSGLVELGVTFLINKGLNSLFGSFIGSKKKDELKIQTIELSTTGSIKMTGSIKFQATGLAAPLRGINATNLGVWNLKDAPQITHDFEQCFIYGRNDPYNEILGEFYKISSDVKYDVVINPTIINEIENIETRYNLVGFIGTEWDKIFKEHYNYERIIGGYNGIYFAWDKLDKNEKRPLILQNPNNDSSKIICIDTKGKYSTFFVNINDRKNKLYTLNPYNYQYYSEYNNAMYDKMSRYTYTSTNNTPFYNVVINNNKKIMLGNIGVNVEVRFRVQATGEEIISSKTFFPEYL